jgi:hypothetical protein
VDAYFDAEHPPKEILLQWYDGKGWEHGAYWGADRIPEGKAGTAARRPMGALPRAGAWVRLEVPANALDLEGVTVHGLAFLQQDGRCHWGAVGTVRVEEPTLVPDATFPMRQTEPGRWAGRFPLTGAGLFRAELRDDRGHANKPMAEMRFVAQKDDPPWVKLEQPGPDLTLSKPQPQPLTVSAGDFYGLREINLLTRAGESGEFTRRTLKSFDAPGKRNFSLVDALKEAADLKMGGVLHYVVEARDRKDQAARTQECVIRIAADANAADQQEAALDKTQDTFRDRLLQMIANQKKVQADVERLHTQYAETADKARAQPEVPDKPPPGSADPKDPTKPPPPPPEGPKLDPETAKKLEELRQELAKLAAEQQKNTQAAAQLNAELAQANAQADKLQTLPKPVADAMAALQRQFEQSALKGMQDFGGQMSQGADAKLRAPDLKDLLKKGDRLEKALENLKNRMDALSAARKGLRDDLAQALRDLQQKMLNESGDLTTRDLEDLRDFIAKMREQLKDLQGQQEDLLKNTEQGGDLSDVERKQADLDKQMEKMLEAAKKLLDAKRKPNRRRPNFPNTPYNPDDPEQKVPPKEDDTNDPLPGQKDPKATDKPGDKKPDDKKDDVDDKEDLFMPALPGSKVKEDERFAKKMRPGDRKPKGDKNDPDGRRDDLESRQDDKLDALKAAEESLAADQQTLEQMLQNLQQAMKANGPKKPAGKDNPPGAEGDDAMQQLAQMLQSPAMQQALAMAGRMRQGSQPGKAPQPGQTPPPTPAGPRDPSSPGNPNGGEAELAKLDPAARAALLKLPPRVREELLQGLRERGPEGYGPFIEDYFKRLTEANEPAKP